MGICLGNLVEMRLVLFQARHRILRFFNTLPLQQFRTGFKRTSNLKMSKINLHFSFAWITKENFSNFINKSK